MRAMVEEQIESESQAFFLSGRIYDDAVIDPRDTRPVLGMCLAIIAAGASAPEPAARFGVYRM
jgi:acetyl-CoA carboxylase carboxyltransferase component